jgi:hypothetical protein
MVRSVTGMPHPSRQGQRKHSYRAVSYGNIAKRSDSGRPDHLPNHPDILQKQAAREPENRRAGGAKKAG